MSLPSGSSSLGHVRVCRKVCRPLPPASPLHLTLSTSQSLDPEWHGPQLPLLAKNLQEQSKHYILDHDINLIAKIEVAQTHFQISFLFRDTLCADLQTRAPA